MFHGADFEHGRWDYKNSRHEALKTPAGDLRYDQGSTLAVPPAIGNLYPSLVREASKVLHYLDKAAHESAPTVEARTRAAEFSLTAVQQFMVSQRADRGVLSELAPEEREDGSWENLRKNEVMKKIKEEFVEGTTMVSVDVTEAQRQRFFDCSCPGRLMPLSLCRARGLFLWYNESMTQTKSLRTARRTRLRARAHTRMQCACSSSKLRFAYACPLSLTPPLALDLPGMHHEESLSGDGKKPIERLELVRTMSRTTLSLRKKKRAPFQISLLFQRILDQIRSCVQTRLTRMRKLTKPRARRFTRRSTLFQRALPQCNKRATRCPRASLASSAVNPCIQHYRHDASLRVHPCVHVHDNQ